MSPKLFYHILLENNENESKIIEYMIFRIMQTSMHSYTHND